MTEQEQIRSKELLDFVKTDAYGERLRGIFQEVITALPVKSWNGSDVPLMKPLPEMLSEMSKNVRDTMVGLAANTKQTEENTNLLKGTKNRQIVIKEVKNFAQHFNEAFKIKFIWKIGIALIGIYVAWHGTHDIWSAITSFIDHIK